METNSTVQKPQEESILAMAFVNIQPLNTVYDAELGYRNGTLFPNLNKPFWRENDIK